jgi:hypothetical protein
LPRARKGRFHLGIVGGRDPHRLQDRTQRVLPGVMLLSPDIVVLENDAACARQLEQVVVHCWGSVSSV